MYTTRPCCNGLGGFFAQRYKWDIFYLHQNFKNSNFVQQSKQKQETMKRFVINKKKFTAPIRYLRKNREEVHLKKERDRGREHEDDNFNAIKTVIIAAGSLLDIGATGFKVNKTWLDDDAEAIAQDWIMVGNTIKDAIQNFEDTEF